jgi:Skp family chaperone for outer membrane proteins
MRGTIGSKAKEKTKSLLDSQKKRIVGELDSMAEAIRQSSEKLQGQGSTARIGERAAQKIENLSSFLEGKDIEQIWTETQRFIRKRPMIFLGAALALGFIFSQIMKGSQDVRER